MMRSKRRNFRRRRSRSGLVMVCVLVCLSIATALVATTTHAALTARQRVRAERHLRQATLLVDAGYHRARMKLAEQSTYTGETWRLPAEALPGFGAAQIEIAIDDATIRIAATLPADSRRPVRRTENFPLPPGRASSDTN